MDTLSGEEKESLIHPFSDDNDYLRNRHDYYRELNSRFDQLGSIDDFNRLKKFLRIDYGHLSQFSGEVYSYIAEEGLKVEEKYLKARGCGGVRCKW
ncbi:hypothetical protein TorRG33x02_042040 [Trema orientale]|uniref:Uncharacterized protein n=1 Tax=Trema orientale TaxID=63057 RepID=A0A2P5FQL9_TREOI|nr:hypothetical protein TorRG33x02_042040 [Trema orientale]